MSDPPEPDLSTVKSSGRRSLSSQTFNHETVIGRTSTTAVHKVTTDAVSHPIAVKQPASHGTLSSNIFDTFRHEGKRWSQLADHPHIVGVVDWGESPLPWLHHDADVPWVAMEYMDGGDLNEYVGELPTEAMYWVAEQLADAIWYAHHDGGGLIHHDLKPGNILFRKTPDEQWNVPKIADWELAQTILNHSDSVGVTTPQYIAPEQAQNESTDQLTDQFQLGIVLYELFTGTHPFVEEPESAPEATQITGILQNEPASPSEIRPALPSALDEILLRMLKKDPSDRYEAMIQVRNALSTIRQDNAPPTDYETDHTEADSSSKSTESDGQSSLSTDTSSHETPDQESSVGDGIGVGTGTVLAVSDRGTAEIQTELANDGVFYLSKIDRDLKPGQDVSLYYEADDPGASDIIEVQPMESGEMPSVLNDSRTFGGGVVVATYPNGRVIIKTDLANDGEFYLSDVDADLQSGETVALRYEGSDPTATDVTQVIPIDEFEVQDE